MLVSYKIINNRRYWQHAIPKSDEAPTCTYSGAFPGQHPEHQRRATLAPGRVVATHFCFCERAQRAAEAGQPLQHPERIIVQSPDCLVRPV